MNNQSKSDEAKNILYASVAAMLIASAAFRFFVFERFEQTTLLYIGLPALITVLMIRFSKKPKTSFGIAFYAITLFLLMAGIFLGEGTVCLIMAAPIFYGVAALVIWVKKLVDKQNKSKFYTIVLIPLLLVIGEVHNINTEPQIQNVTVTRIIDGSASLNALNKSPDFMSDLPGFFQLGFPEPKRVTGSGIEVGSYREITFVSSTKGPGILRFEIVESSASELVFMAVFDDTHINHWMTWKKVKVTLDANADGTSTITWSTDYYCDLAPTWYFEPLEAYAIETSTNYLISSYFESN